MWHTQPAVMCLAVAAILLLSGTAILIPVTRAAFTAAQKTELVVIHNRLREAVYPTATKMNFLTWNTRLESLAQATANNCTGEHNYGGDYQNLGENIYAGFRTNATEIVLAWHIEKAAYSYGTATCNTAGLSPLNSCGHYLQVISDGVLEIGCGHHLCGTSNNMVYCEYSSGSASPPYATGDTSCSRCPTNRGRCLNGLCVNSSMVAMADVQAYDATATAGGTQCKLNCSNCGVSATMPGVVDCYCICPSTVSTGTFCDTRLTNSQLTCSVCSNLTTPCLNGGTDQNGTSCSCQCPDSYVGRQCQIYKPHYLNGMRLRIGTQQFCAFGQCLGVPLTRTVFKASVWSSIRSAIASAVNDFCNSDAASFAACCSTGQKPPSAKQLIAAADVGYLDNADLATDNAGSLFVVVYANVSTVNNALCPASSRRKRAVSVTQPMVSQAALQSAIRQFNGSISAALGACCSSSVESLATYESYASAKYGIPVSSVAAEIPGSSGRLLWLCLLLAVTLGLARPSVL